MHLNRSSSREKEKIIVEDNNSNIIIRRTVYEMGWTHVRLYEFIYFFVSHQNDKNNHNNDALKFYINCECNTYDE